MRHRLITIVSSTAVALAGCSSAPRNFAPELRFAPANAGVYSAKWHACRQQVADASKDRRDRHQSAAVGAARAGHDTYEIDFFDDDEEEDLDADGRTSVTSLMANLLLDLGNDSGMSFYAGAGAGWARVKNRIEVVDEEDPQDAVNLSKSGLAWQLIAGVRTAVSDNIDLGLKYRYFQTRRLKFDRNDEDFGDLGISSRFRSHSLLASLVYNFAAPAAPLAAPPPPPPAPAVAPATQTCPDGSVVLVTEPCPIPPPPPPPAMPERG